MISPFVVRPHIAYAAAEAAHDATVLAAALHGTQHDVQAGLASFEALQLDYGRDMTRHGIHLGQNRAAQAR